MEYSGRIIEYIEHGKFICALVVGEDGRRLRLLNQNGREVKLAMGRVLHSTSRSVSLGVSREEVQRFLKERNGLREELSEQVLVGDIWELASSEVDDRFSPEFLAALCFGREADEDQVAAFLRAVFRDRIYLKYREGQIIVNTPETVEQLLKREEAERAREALLDRGGDCLRLLALGEDPGDWPERERCLALIQEYYLFGSDFAEYDLARDLLKRAGLTTDHDAHRLLVAAGIWQEDENIPLLRQRLPVDFPAEVLAEAEGAEEFDLDQLLAEGYKDLTHLPVLTIDGGGTRDFDDGLHVERRGDNFLVGVHIAAVSHYVKIASGLFEEARRRCSSLYFPEGSIPMLPEGLSEGVCSLIKDRIRPTMSFMLLLNPAGELLETRIIPGVVRVKRQLTYEQVNGMLDGDEELALLDDLAGKLRERRLAAGALIMPFPDVVIKISDDEISISLEDADSGSRVLVSEFMVLANSAGAAWLTDRLTPGLFRSQDPPNKRLFEGFQRELLVNFRQRRFLKPARLTTRPKPHSCVGVSQYSTMTSPIRRFLDLVMQHQLMSMLRGGGVLFQEHDLKGFVDELTRTQSSLNLVGRLRRRYWILRRLEKLVGERVTALVIDNGPRRIRVALTESLLECDLPKGGGVRAEPGEIVSLKVARVSCLDDELRLEWT